MRWMVFMISWTRAALKSEFRFWTKPTLGVRASDAFDLPMVGYLLELLRDRFLFGAFCGLPATAGPDLGVIVR
jgi:hypothetical protein